MSAVRPGPGGRVSIVVSSDSRAAAIRPLVRMLSEWGVGVIWRSADFASDIAAYSRWLTLQERAGIALLLIADDCTGELASYAAAVTAVPVALLVDETGGTGEPPPPWSGAPVARVSFGDVEQTALCIARLLLPVCPAMKPRLNAVRLRRRNALQAENLELSSKTPEPAVHSPAPAMAQPESASPASPAGLPASTPPRDVSPHASGASAAHLAKAAAAAVARAEEMIRENRREKAEELLSTALRLEPENPKALRLLDGLKQEPS